MTYENAFITLEEVEKYQLDQDYERSQRQYGLFINLKIGVFERTYKNQMDWAIKRKNGNYLRLGGIGNRILQIGIPGHIYYLFKWKEHYLFPEIRMERNQESDK